MDVTRTPADSEFEVRGFEETIKAELTVNLKIIAEDYVEGVLHLPKYFSVETSSGRFRGKIVIFDNGINGKGIDIFMNKIDTKGLDVKTYLLLGRRDRNNHNEDNKILSIDTVGSNTNRIRSTNNEEPNYKKGIRVRCAEHRPELQITSIEGDITLIFKSTPEFKSKQRAKNALIQSRILSKGGNTFDIVCKGEVITFDKELLAISSPVFQRMLFDSIINKEAMSNSVKIDDFDPSTIKTFKKFLFEDEEIEEERDFTPQLLMFCNKYDVEGLFKMCREYLMRNINAVNIFELIKSAYFLDDNKLLKSTALFIHRNIGSFQENPDFNSFRRTHPQCFVQIVNLMMFDDSLRMAVGHEERMEEHFYM